ncbi:MAG: hypothetical protein SGILL_003762 [Bacillariaceae sp.]
MTHLEHTDVPHIVLSFHRRINKPGGCAKITQVHRTVDGNYVESLDVKYLVGGGSERNVDPAIVSHFETLERGGRKRRGRDFLHERDVDVTKQEAVAANAAVDGLQQQQDAEDLASSGRSQRAAAGARRGGNGSSPQSSTSFSTPEKKRNKHRPPKKVTPVPTIVSVGRTMDEVSPMSEDRPALIGRSRPNETSFSVARGLNFNTSSTKESKNNTVALKAKQPRLGAENELTNCSSDMDKKPSARPLSSGTQKQPSSQPTSAQQKKRIVGVRLKSTTGMVASRCAVKRPVKKSFSRTKSAYGDKDITQDYSTTTSKAAATTPRKPMLDVYRDEFQKARDFMDEMVAPRSQDDLNLGGGDDSASNAESSSNARFMKVSP